jgi:hypothetical protein
MARSLEGVAEHDLRLSTQTGLQIHPSVGQWLAVIEEAVTIRRELARARPRVYLARFASSLRLMADALAAMGRESEADAVRAEAASLE